jgi:hypothetical protein
LRSADASSTETPVEIHDHSEQKVENHAGLSEASLQDGIGQMNQPKTGLDFSMSIANVRAYQGKLLKVTQAQEFACDFS